MSGNALIPLMGEPMNLARNVAGGAVTGNQLMSLIEDRKMAPMRQQAAQMEVEAGKITLSKEKAIERLRNAAIDGSYIRRDLASGDLNTAISRMEQRNRRIMESGGDNQHTQQWLSALSSRDPAQIQAVAAEMEEIERAYQAYGGGGGAGSTAGASAKTKQYVDGTVQMVMPDGSVQVRLPNGQTVQGEQAALALQQAMSNEVAYAGQKAGAAANAQGAAKVEYAGPAAFNAGVGGTQGNQVGAMGGQGVPSAADVEAAKIAASEAAKNTASRLAGAPEAIIRGERLVNLLDKGLTHPGRLAATGKSSVFNPVAIPGTDRKDYLVLANQFKGSGFLEAYQLLKGGGAITNIEGEKAEQAQNRLNEAQSEQEYEVALKEMRDLAAEGVTRTRRLLEQNGQQPQSAAPPQGSGIQFLGFE